MSLVNDVGLTAEYLFAAECLKLGWLPIWPSSKLVSYDIGIDNGKNILRVQVKATNVKNKTSDAYKINTTKNGDKSYQKGELDFLAAYVSQTNTWYIFPADVIVGKKAITLYPHRSSESVGQYEHFKNEWGLLRG